MEPVGKWTIGVDLGTTSVKAVAVDGNGKVLARTRIAHSVGIPTADSLEHDAQRAWRRGPRRAFATVSGAGEGPAAAVVTTGMVPSMTAVNRRGVPQLPGILYGDARAWRPLGVGERPSGPHDNGDEAGEGARMLAWAVSAQPGAAGYWPSQAVATHALSGVPAVDSVTASSFGSLHSGGRWDRQALAALGIDERQVAVVAPLGRAVGELPGTPTKVGGGSIDAFCEQLVAGADNAGDVLAIFGATLVVWIVTDSWADVPGLTTYPAMAPGLVMIGGASNAGGLFSEWVRRLTRTSSSLAPPSLLPDPYRVPVFLPYLRGERSPFHDPGLRASIHGLDISAGPSVLVRAAEEASGFVIRRLIGRAGVPARRVVAAGGGSRSASWMQAVADATGLPVDAVAVPEGAALGECRFSRQGIHDFRAAS